jgi:hypothetical protein
MGYVPVNRAGLTLAGVLAAWHAIWAALAAFGVAQPLYDFVFRLHFMRSDAAMGAFDLASAGMLIGLTAAVGYLTGAALAVTWNCLTAFAETASARRHGTATIGRSGRPSGAS